MLPRMSTRVWDSAWLCREPHGIKRNARSGTRKERQQGLCVPEDQVKPRSALRFWVSEAARLNSDGKAPT